MNRPVGDSLGRTSVIPPVGVSRDTGRPSVRADAVASGVARVVGYGMSFLAIVAVSRTMGPEGRGLISLGTAFPGLVVAVIALGLGSAATIGVRERWLAKYDAMVILVAYALLVGLASLTVGVWAMMMDDSPGDIMPVIVAAPVGGLLLADYAAGLLQGAGRVRLGMGLRQLVGLGQASIAVVLIIVGVRDAFAILSIMAVWAWACGVLGMAAVARSAWSAEPGPAKATIRSLASVGVRTQAIWILLALNYRADIVLLGALGTTVDVGVYSVAVGFSEAAWLVVNALVAILLPYVSGVDTATARARTARVVRASVPATAGSGAVLAVGLGFLAVPVLGPGFERVPVVFLLLAPGLTMLAAFKVLAIHAIGTRDTRTLTSLAAVGVVANVAANVVLIPSFGSIGAAIASSISYSLISGLAIARYLRRPRAILTMETSTAERPDGIAHEGAERSG